MKSNFLYKVVLVAIVLSIQLVMAQNKVAPMWSNNSNIYEVNLRQYSTKSGFAEFAKELPRLKKMGVELLWFMPIHPVGVEGRKGSLGSYYAVKNYKEVSSEFGSMDDFKAMVKLIHSMDMKIIIDWVANHTSPDNVWVKDHPEYYVRDEKGKFVPPVPDWSDVIDLDYNNKNLRLAMIDAMNFWLKETDIDGFRCDVAEMVPTDFWIECRKELDKTKKIFFLAEGENPELHQAFDMTYSWKVYHAFKGFFKKEKTLDEVKKIIDDEKKDYKADDLRMYFTSNHDENSWNATEFEAFGKFSSAISVVTYTLKGMPLIYSGQEAAYDHRLKFFDKDAIVWGNYPLNDFYTSLSKLKKNNSALDAGKDGGEMSWINTNNNSILSYQRTKGKNKVAVFVNLSDSKQTVDVSAIEPNVYLDYFNNQSIDLSKNKSIDIEPNAYKVLIVK